MNLKMIFLFLFSTSILTWAQNGFQFENNMKKINIPFKWINNLIFIPLKVNGTEMNFLLDSGSESTILFSLDDQDEVGFNKVEKIKLKGFGYNEYVEGLKSMNNVISYQGFTDTNHTIYIVLDQNFNFSSQIGIPVNGIIGYDFFKNHLIEINYEKHKITIYRNDKRIKKRLNSDFTAFPITIENNKPYLQAIIENGIENNHAKMLLDTGNSDALWIFKNKNNTLSFPGITIEDYLGHGFSGALYGKRGRISKLKMDAFEFQNPIVSFPDSTAVDHSNLVQERVGSIGSEIIKRFHIVFDYPNQKIYLDKNENYELPFNYNMSGLEIEHDGLQWIQEHEELNKGQNGVVAFDLMNEKPVNFKYKFVLKPIFKITNVRSNSAAALSGIQKDDIILSLNGKPIYNYDIQRIEELLKSEEGKWIQIEVERGNAKLTFKFQLLKII